VVKPPVIKPPVIKLAASTKPIAPARAKTVIGKNAIAQKTVVTAKPAVSRISKSHVVAPTKSKSHVVAPTKSASGKAVAGKITVKVEKREVTKVARVDPVVKPSQRATKPRS